MRPVKGMFETFPEHVHKTEYGDSVITLIIPLEQSHLAIHTWPAQKLVCVDLFTCGDRFDAKRAVNNLIEAFEGKAKRYTGFKRGRW
jgi:S-adenosylmethionine/arginine decarboxylase-like enzyme